MTGDPYEYLFVQPTPFDSDDISAMILSVHKAVIRALDQSGIDTTELRIKETFSGGRRGEDI
jgi:hypothetical protein